MHDYLFPITVVRFAFVLGVVVSILLYERRHLTTGSIVVPGYVAVFMLMPSVLLATLVNAAVSYLVVNKLLLRWFLLYGRTKFTILALVSITLQAVMLKASPSGAWLWEADVPLFVGVGYVVPALIAHDMARQGIAKTAGSVLLASAIVAVPIVGGVVLRLPEVTQLSPFRPISRMHLEAGWIPLAIVLSAAAAWAVARNYGLRSGGFVGAALVAIFAVNPWQVLFLGLVAVITHQVVTRVLMTRLILFGRRKFASMLMISSAIVWVAIWAGQRFFPLPVQEHLGVASLALTPLFLPGLIANDMQRASVARVLAGVTLASTCVLTVTWSVQALVTRQPQAPVRTVVAATTACVVFAPQLLGIVTSIVTQVRALTWPRRLVPDPVQAGPAVAPLPVIAVAASTLLEPVPTAAPGVHPARPFGHRPAPVTATDPNAWLAGRRQAIALADRPAKHLVPSKGYRPRHLATTGTR